SAVSGLHLIALDPPSQTVRPGETATYDVLLQNATPQVHGYSLQIKGVPLSWVSLPAGVAGSPGYGFVNVQPNSTADVKLQLTPGPGAGLGDYSFMVVTIADVTGSATIATDSAEGNLTLAGQPVAPPYLDAHGVVATLTPSAASAGQGTSARYTVRLINT